MRLIAAVVCVLAAFAASAETTLTVMSFNLRYGLAADGENAWPKRRELLLETIRLSDPDILGTQECLKMQADYLASNLTEYDRLGIGREADGGGESTVIFFKRTILLPLECGNFWLSETPDVPGSKSWDSSLPRIATWIRFHHIPAGRAIFVVNTHFDHVGKVARESSAALIGSRVANVDQSTPVIITGDFNATAESSAPWNTLIQAGLQDAWTAAGERAGPVTTWSAFRAPDPDSDRRIDWILFRGPLRALHCETITHNDNGRYPSDHFPVTARFAIMAP